MKKLIPLVLVAVAAAFVSVAWAGDAPAKTCGQMTADQAGMPAKLAEMMNAYADEADAHAAFMTANAKGNKDAATEADGMKKLAQTYRDTAAQLTKTADAMKAAGSWPAAPHDVKKLMADAKVKAANDKTSALQKEFGAMIAKAGPPPAAKTDAPAAPPAAKK